MRKRYIQIDGELIEAEKVSLEPRAAYVIPDIQPYRSMIDGHMVTSRSEHRAHLKQHNCVEVGNDSSLHKPPPPLQSPPGLRETIARQVYSKLRY